MAFQFEREVTSVTVALTTSAGTTPQIAKGLYSKGVIHVPAGSSITSLTFHAATESNGTYLPLYEERGSGATAACTRTVSAGKSYELPAAISGAPFIKIVADAAGSVTISLTGE